MSYEIGFGKPPVATRFRPGQSGNPRGRPKGSKNHKKLFGELLQAEDSNRAKGEPRFSCAEGIVRALVDAAAAGEMGAIAQLMKIVPELDCLSEPFNRRRGKWIDWEAVSARARGETETETQVTSAARPASEPTGTGWTEAEWDALFAEPESEVIPSEQQPANSPAVAKVVVPSRLNGAPHIGPLPPISPTKKQEVKPETPAQRRERQQKKREREEAKHKWEMQRRRTHPLERPSALAREQVVASIGARSENW